MKKKNQVLGIDCSNYTSSVAVVNEDTILYDFREMLKVKPGNRGLRQSEAFFQHSNNLPSMMENINEFDNIGAICVSSWPRRVSGSYMPCFKAGRNYARVLSNILHVPMYEVSHQEGHIRAALIDSNIDALEPFLCVHLSGGTTEILVVENDVSGYKTSIVGKTLDISAGMLIDRVGVSLGIQFPCGAYMDGKYDENCSLKLPTSVLKNNVSFSGVETRVHKLISEKNYSKQDIISAVFNCVADTLSSAVKRCMQDYSLNTAIFAGGVSSSKNISKRVKNSLLNAGDIIFADEKYCSDNAVGVALLGENFYED